MKIPLIVAVLVLLFVSFSESLVQLFGVVARWLPL
jgi:hypothetical protein